MSHYNLGASADSTTVDKVPHVDADVGSPVLSAVIFIFKTFFSLV